MTNVRRTAKIWISCKKNSIKNKLLDSMCYHSKAIYNSCLYFQRQMYYIRTLLIEYYIDNIDDYYGLFSISDIIHIIKYIIKHNPTFSQKEIKICCNLLKRIYKGDISTVKKKINNKKIDKLINIMIKKKLIKKKGKLISISMNYNLIATTLNNYKNKLNFIKDKNRLNIFINRAIEIFKLKDSIYNSDYSKKRREYRKRQREEEEKKKSSVKRMDRAPLGIKQVNKKFKKTVKNIQNTNIYTKHNIIIPMFYTEDVCDLYIRTFIPSYKYLYSQVAQQTIKKVNLAYKSFFASIKTFSNKSCNYSKNNFKSKNRNKKINMPKYLNTDNYNLIFQKTSFKIINKKKQGSLLKLSIGKNLPNLYHIFQLNNYNIPIYINKCKNKYPYGKQIIDDLLVKSFTQRKKYCKNDIIIDKKYIINKNRIYDMILDLYILI